jgi:hypothetical protein
LASDDQNLSTRLAVEARLRSALGMRKEALRRVPRPAEDLAAPAAEFGKGFLQGAGDDY